MSQKIIRRLCLLFLCLLCFSVEAGMEVYQKIHFSKYDPKLKKVSMPVLKDVVEVVKAYPDSHYIITIISYTDAIGTNEDNLRISHLQGEETKKELVKLGLPSYMLRVEAYGEEHPIDTNETASGRANNRRAEFRPIADIKRGMPLCWGTTFLQDPVFFSYATSSEEKNYAELKQAKVPALLQREFYLNCLMSLYIRGNDQEKALSYFNELLQWNRQHPSQAPLKLFNSNILFWYPFFVEQGSWEKIQAILPLTDKFYPKNSFERAELLNSIAKLYVEKRQNQYAQKLYVDSYQILKKQFKELKHPRLREADFPYSEEYEYNDPYHYEEELNTILDTTLYFIKQGDLKRAKDLAKSQQRFAKTVKSHKIYKNYGEREELLAWFLLAELENALNRPKKAKKLYQKAFTESHGYFLSGFEKNLNEKIKSRLR